MQSSKGGNGRLYTSSHPGFAVSDADDHHFSLRSLGVREGTLQSSSSIEKGGVNS